MVHRKEKATEIGPSAAEAGWIRIPGLGAGVEARRAAGRLGEAAARSAEERGAEEKWEGSQGGCGAPWPSRSRCRRTHLVSPNLRKNGGRALVNHVGRLEKGLW